jgi:diketogulonate reductase-like aldo/keto reductase
VVTLPNTARSTFGTWAHGSYCCVPWLLAQGEHIVPIPGSRSATRVEENAHAADVALTGADLAAIKEILPAGGFGGRYAEGHVPTWI